MRRSPGAWLASFLLATSLLSPAFAPIVHAQDGVAGLENETRALARTAGAAVVAVYPGARAAGRGGGTGFIIDGDEGLVLTTSKIVEGVRGTVRLTFRGGLRANAKVVSWDPSTRVGLLKIEDVPALAKRLGGKLPVIELGTSEKLAAGRLVATIANPFDALEDGGVPAISVGIVSSHGRTRDIEGYNGVAIETDAAVNTGCYGGPLLDREGRAVGVVIDSYSPSRWLGVAVPIDFVKAVLPDLRAGRRPAAPPAGLFEPMAPNANETSYLGVRIGDGPDGRSQVIEVAPGSPAAKAGISKGDRIVKISYAGGVTTGDIDQQQISALLSRLQPGTVLTIVIERDGWEKRVNVGLGELPGLAHPRPAAGGAFLGVNTVIREGSGGGLKIERVVEGTPADKGGLKVGDVILEADGKVMKEPEDLVRVIQSHRPGDKIVVRVERAEWARRFEITLGARTGDLVRPVQPTPEPKTPEPAPAGKPAFLGVALHEGSLVIDDTAEGSPARAAGLKGGDKITGYYDGDGRKAIHDAAALSKLLESRRAGDELVLEVERDGWSKRVKVKLGERPGE